MQLSRIQKKVALNSLSHHAPSFEIHQELKGVNSLAAVGAALRGLPTLVAWSSLLRTFPMSADHCVAGGLEPAILVAVGGDCDDGNLLLAQLLNQAGPRPFILDQDCSGPVFCLELLHNPLELRKIIPAAY
jgi:hypothetical protein